MFYSEQLRAARSLLGWNQNELARQSKVGIATIRRIEGQKGPVHAISETVWRLQGCLEQAGIEFIDADGEKGPGVRLAHPILDT